MAFKKIRIIFKSMQATVETEVRKLLYFDCKYIIGHFVTARHAWTVSRGSAKACVSHETLNKQYKQLLRVFITDNKPFFLFSFSNFNFEFSATLRCPSKQSFAFFTELQNGFFQNIRICYDALRQAYSLVEIQI